MSNPKVQTVPPGLPAKDWLDAFRSVGVEQDRLELAKSDMGKATIIGNFLVRQLNRAVRIEVDGRLGTATLRSAKGRSGKKPYYFEIVWDDEQPASEHKSPEDLTPSGEPQPAQHAKAATSTTTSPERTSTQKDPINPDPRSAPGSAAANDEAW